MNPEKRFGQIEELLADVVIKVDRLADGQGKQLEYVAKQGADIEELQTDLKEIKTDVESLQTDVKEIKTDVESLQTDVKEIKTDVKELKTVFSKQIDTTARAVGTLTVGFNELKQELDQVTQTQQQILDFLKEKLS